MSARRSTITPPTGGQHAKQRAAIVLAVLSGDCPIVEASRRLGVSVPRYYALERHALQGLVEALEDTQARRTRCSRSRRVSRPPPCATGAFFFPAGSIEQVRHRQRNLAA